MINKKTKAIIGMFLMLLGVTVGFYQYKLSKVVSDNLVPIVVAKDTITIGQCISESDVNIEYVNPKQVMDNSFTDIKSVVNSISKETIRPHQQPVIEQLDTSDNYQSNDIQLISISGSNDLDTFVANDLRPGDIVDLYYKTNGEGGIGTIDPELKELKIVDVKNQEGISYRNKVADQPFAIKSALIWLDNNQRSKVIKAHEKGLIPQFTIHSNRTIINVEDKYKLDKLDKLDKIGGK